MEIKAVLFDLDNTLYDYEPVYKKSLKAVHEILKNEIKMSYKDFLELYSLAQMKIKRELAGTASAHNRVLYFQRLVEKTHNTINPEIILKLYNAYWDTFLENMKLKIGVIETFDKLRKNKIKIAIVPGLTTNIQLKKFSKLNIAKYVDILVTSGEAGSEKPSSIMFLLTLNKLKLKTEEAIMIGDNPINDIEGANAVGLDTVLITDKESTKYKFNKDYQKPNYTIKEIPEISDILN